MDDLDAFDKLYGTSSKVIALLTVALDYGEMNGADDVIMTIMEISLELIKSSQAAWDLLEKELR